GLGEIELRLGLLVLLEQALRPAGLLGEEVVGELALAERGDEERGQEGHVDHHRDGEELGEVEVDAPEEAGLGGLRRADEARDHLDRTELDARDVVEIDAQGGALLLPAVLAPNRDLAAPGRVEFGGIPLDLGDDVPAFLFEVDLEVRTIVAADRDLPVLELTGLEDGVAPDEAHHERAAIARRPDVLRQLLVEERRSGAATLQPSEVQPGAPSARRGGA